MPRSPEALVTPDLLKWARERAGYSLDQAAAKLAISIDCLGSWERGESRPSFAQLRKLANLYKRPIAVFFLPEPPRGFQVMSEFRRLPQAATENEPLSPHLLLEIRNLMGRREDALELLQVLTDSPPVFSYSIQPGSDPDRVANNIRHWLQIPPPAQIPNQPYRALRWWTDAVESKGVLVSQITSVPVEEARGLCLSERPLPAIALNAKDSATARIFTLMHEFTHLALNQSTVCDMISDGDGDAIEQFCNRVAGSVLVPASMLFSHPIVAGRKRSWWDDADIRQLAAYFRVSREVVARRLTVCGLAPFEYYAARREEFIREYLRRGSSPRSRPDYYRVVINRNGRMFSRLAFDAYHSGRIGLSDVAFYLDVAPKHVQRLERVLTR